jgi:hypothetical protein
MRGRMAGTTQYNQAELLAALIGKRLGNRADRSAHHGQISDEQCRYGGVPGRALVTHDSLDRS